MMKKMLLALLALAVTVVPTFAADDSAPAMKPGMNMEMKPDMKHMMHQHPDMKQHMMQNPQHLLAMSYHKNLVTFAQALGKVARQGDTVPRDFARAAVTEMRRSADQMEINHEAALRSLPADQKEKQAEMAKMMSTHLTEMRTQLAQLEEITKGDRIDSKELLKHLESLLKGCEGMRRDGGMCGAGMHEGMGKPGKGMHGGCGCMQGGAMHDDCDMHGMHGAGKQGGCMHGEGMQGEGMQGGCMHDGAKQGGCGCMHGEGMHGKKMRPGGAGGWQEMMQQRHKMMEAMKAQDAELAKMVEAMNRAPKDQKQAIMADILTKMVKQRAEMDAQLEKLQGQMNGHMLGKPGPHQSMHGMDSAADDDSYDSDSDDMGSDDMDSDDADSDASSNMNMDMKDMNMQDK